MRRKTNIIYEKRGNKKVRGKKGKEDGEEGERREVWERRLEQRGSEKD